MKKATLSAVILVVLLTVAGCSTERYAEYRSERPVAVDTLSTANKQEMISFTKSRDKDYYYSQDYRFLFAN
ncbi:MAG: hypothetical protein WBZ48_01250 [Bacteroidota bacterium]